jgi:hypothetical protein
MRKLFLSALFLTVALIASACEITLSVEKGAKEKYNPGDEVVVLVKMSFTHKVCNVSLEKTKFDGKGLEILGGTDWKETSPNVWERKVKVKITGTASGESVLSVLRTCDKMGGSATIGFKSKPVKEKVSKKK